MEQLRRDVCIVACIELFIRLRINYYRLLRVLFFCFPPHFLNSFSEGQLKNFAEKRKTLKYESRRTSDKPSDQTCSTSTFLTKNSHKSESNFLAIFPPGNRQLSGKLYGSEKTASENSFGGKFAVKMK